MKLKNHPTFFSTRKVIIACCAFVTLLTFLVMVLHAREVMKTHDSFGFISRKDAILLQRKPSDSITIRVDATKSKTEIWEFVAHYSTCSSVYAIQIVARTSILEYDLKSLFSRVKGIYEFGNVEIYLYGQSPSEIRTEGIFLLDSDVFVSCEELKFTVNVWLSSRDSVVGYYPRLIQRNINTNGIISYRYLGWPYVWWNGIYSLMLPAAALMHRKYITSMNGRTQLAEDLRRALQTKSHCSDVAVALWTIAQGAPPPIWISAVIFNRSPSKVQNGIGFTLEKVSGYPNVNSNVKRTECLNYLIPILNIQTISYSYHKASMAKNELFW